MKSVIPSIVAALAAVTFASAAVAHVMQQPPPTQPQAPPPTQVQPPAVQPPAPPPAQVQPPVQQPPAVPEGPVVTEKIKIEEKGQPTTEKEVKIKPGEGKIEESTPKTGQ